MTDSARAAATHDLRAQGREADARGVGPRGPGELLEPCRPRRILVIDDEAAIGRAIRRFLEPHVVDVELGVEPALARCESGRYDLILCDLTMPGRDGVDFHDELALARPDLLGRVVFMTGGAVTGRASAFIEAEATRWIRKPLRAPELLGLLDAGEG